MNKKKSIWGWTVEVTAVLASVATIIGLALDAGLLKKEDTAPPTAPTSAVISAPETTAPVTENSRPEDTAIPEETFVYLNELPIAEKIGKVWTRSTAPVPAGYHTNSDAPGCWYYMNTPGHTSGPVQDQKGNVYTYGIHVDGDADTARVYSITYKLDGKYSYFSGYAACPGVGMISHTISEGQTKYFTIFLDEKEISPFGSVSISSDRQYFNIPVSGVQTLRIQYPATSYPNEIATLFDGKLS